MVSVVSVVSVVSSSYVYYYYYGTMNFFNKKLLLLSVACLGPLANGEAPYPSTYTAPEHNPTLITNATVLTGDGKRLEGASVYFVNGKIVEVTDSAPEVAANTRVIDGQGR